MSVVATPPQGLDVMGETDMNLHTQKRKCAHQDKQAGADEASAQSPAQKKTKINGTPKESISPAMVELKSGKLVLKQKSISWDKTMPVLQAILGFNEYMSQQSETMAEVPDEYLHVIAKLTHESDKTVSELAKSIKSTLMPASDLDSQEDSQGASAGKASLPVSAVQAAIGAVADRCNYGLELSALEGHPGLGGECTLSPSVQIWRWEVRDMETMLPKESMEKLRSRRLEREQASSDALALFKSLPAEEQTALLTSRKRSRPSANSAAGPSAEKPSSSTGEPKKSKGARSRSKKQPEVIVLSDQEDIEEGSSKVSNTDSKVDSETTKSKKESAPSSSTNDGESRAKEQEKQAKEEQKRARIEAREQKKAEREAKEAKKRAERERAEQTKAKSVNFMSSFLQAHQKSPSKEERVPAPNKVQKTDFERTFFPCDYKDLAPVNCFKKSNVEDVSSAINKSEDSASDLLREFKARLPHRKRDQSRTCRKGVHSPVSVREVMRAVAESDIMGGNAEENAKASLARLKDRSLVPIKLLQFESDRRRGWYGTWTRSTNLIGPRTPLGQDPVSLDYTLDSDAEWEEADQVDGDDVMSADGREEDGMTQSEDDSDLDDWLEDDLEMEEVEEDDEVVEVDAAGAVLQWSGVFKQPAAPSLAPIPNMLKPKKKVPKPFGRRFESKLVPFQTGPHWETAVGESAFDNFDPYRIELLNDAYFGLNPFTFVSTEEADAGVANPETPSKADAIRPAGQSTLKQLPEKENSPLKAPLTPTSSSSGTPGGSRVPKQPFPDAHLPTLLRAVEGSTRARPLLVEELREKFANVKGASKGAIEVRLTQCCMRESKKQGARWIVKEEWKKRCNLT